MSDTIWKFPVVIDDSFVLALPVGAKVLSVQAQNDAPNMWVLLDQDTKQPFVNRLFRVYGTGHMIQDRLTLEFIGTFQLMGGRLVFHLFEDRNI